MTNILISAVCFLLALGFVVAKKNYFAVPARELNKRKTTRDKNSKIFARAVSKSPNLNTFLWSLIVLLTSAAAVLLARSIPAVIAVVIIALFFWLMFSVIPSSRVTKFGTRLTLIFTPLIIKLVDISSPVLSKMTAFAGRFYTKPFDSGIYDKQDIVDLLTKQLNQQGSRLTQEEIDIIKRSLIFSDKKVSQILTPIEKVKFLSQTEIIGPIVINEIHESGSPYVLITDNKDDRSELVGVLAFSSLTLESEGRIGQFMNSPVYYLNQEDDLNEALHAMFVSNAPIFVVVNRQGKNIGVITLGDVIKELMGHIPEGSFKEYSDKSLVSSKFTEEKTKHVINLKKMDNDQ